MHLLTSATTVISVDMQFCNSEHARPSVTDRQGLYLSSHSTRRKDIIFFYHVTIQNVPHFYTYDVNEIRDADLIEWYM